MIYSIFLTTVIIGTTICLYNCRDLSSKRALLTIYFIYFLLLSLISIYLFVLILLSTFIVFQCLVEINKPNFVNNSIIVIMLLTFTIIAIRLALFIIHLHINNIAVYIIQDINNIISVSNNIIKIDSSNIDDTNNVCSICLDNLTSESYKIKCSCKYLYHKECITKWLDSHNHCLICKKILS